MAPPEPFSHIGTVMRVHLRVLGTRVLLFQGTIVLGPSRALPEYLPMGSGGQAGSAPQLTEGFSRSRGEVSSSASMMVSKGDRVSSSVLSRISVMAVSRDSSFCASRQTLLCCKGRDSLRGRWDTTTRPRHGGHCHHSHPCHSQGQPGRHIPHLCVSSHLAQRKILNDGDHRGVEIVLHCPQDPFSF